VSKMFSRYWRTGDGSDPFHRYDYLLSEYKKAMLNLIVECPNNLEKKSMNETEDSKDSG